MNDENSVIVEKYLTYPKMNRLKTNKFLKNAKNLVNSAESTFRSPILMTTHEPLQHGQRMS